MVQRSRLSVLRLLLVCALFLAGCGEDRLARVRALQNQGDFEAALELLGPMVEEQPDDSELLYRYGLSLSATGSYTSALWSLRRAMQDPNWRIPAATQLAISLLAGSDAVGALEAVDAILEIDPGHVAARMMRIQALTKAMTRHEEVLEEVDIVLELDPENVDAMASRVASLIALERIDEAAAAMEEIGERLEGGGEVSEATQAWLCAINAIFTEERGELDQAALQYAACVEAHPAHGMVVENTVRFLNATGEAERAYEILRNAVELAPASLQMRMALVAAAKARGDNEEAERVLREYAEGASGNDAIMGWGALRAHYVQVGDFAAARDAASKALEIGRQTGEPAPQLVFEYADSLILAGELDAALEVAAEITVGAHRALIEGRVLLLQGKPGLAFERFDDANTLWPNNAVARYYAAVAAEQAGDVDRAIEEYRQSFRIQAGATDAVVRLSRIHLAEGKVEVVANLLKSYLHKVPVLDRAAELLLIRVLARTNRIAPLDERLRRLAGTPQAGSALAAAVEGVVEQGGPEAGLAFLDTVEGLDLTHPFVADTLRVYVRLVHEVGKPELAAEAVAAGRERHPELPVFHEIEALDLALRGEPEAARRAYLRATELDPANGAAWSGLGRIDAPTDLDRALESFELALATSEEPADVNYEVAQALIAAGRLAEAGARLESVLEDRPYDRRAAESLLAIELGQDEPSSRSLDLARRAVRFGGGAPALDRLAEVYERLGEPGLAARAQERARVLRTQDSAEASEPAST